mmetsp:Transcript_17477/g.30369  ORF Transcript_17477/g.30369 Transcript_17477/m.30369 type:complete len:91 (-) Transcript_17477:872-1144(-)
MPRFSPAGCRWFSVASEDHAELQLGHLSGTRASGCLFVTGLHQGSHKGQRSAAEDCSTTAARRRTWATGAKLLVRGVAHVFAISAGINGT